MPAAQPLHHQQLGLTCQPLHHRSGTMRDRIHSLTQNTLEAGGTIPQVVVLPPGESCAGWVAAHAVDFFNDLCLLWQALSSDPSVSTFKPGEGYPSGVEYRWSSTNSASSSSLFNSSIFDLVGTALPSTIRVSAPQYITLVLQWISEQLNDPSNFPCDARDEQRVYATPQFAALCGQIFRRLFRVYAILYTSFFGTLEALGTAPHLNSCFKHFIYFCSEFNLLSEREVSPLSILVEPVRQQYYTMQFLDNLSENSNNSEAKKDDDYDDDDE